MCRFQRHGHEIKSAWAGMVHMRKTSLKMRGIFVRRCAFERFDCGTWLRPL